MAEPMTYAVGDARITRIVELGGPLLPIKQLLPELTDEMLDAHRPWLAPEALDADDRAILLFQSYVLQTPQHNILIDTCLGNDKTLPQAPDWNMRTGDAYERALGATGLRFADIDYVLCTHLHADHVGWNTRLVDGRWSPTFPNARYVFSAEEVRFWEDAYARAESAVFAESVVPVLEVGRAELVADDAAIGDHLRFLPTPGHTPHHVAILLGARADDAVFAGDVLHSPLQFRYPDLTAITDRNDPAAAAVTRRAFLERFAETRTLCCFAHTPLPSAGFVKRAGAGFSCVGV